MMDGIILPQGVVQHQHQQQQQKQQSLHRSNSSRKDTSRRMAPSRKSEVDLLHKRKEVISHAIEELGRTITKLNESSGFETAFQALDTESMKQYQHSRCKAGRANAHLNRYNDIVPYDASRVVLHKCTPDYINASHIQQLMPGTPNFIATQGPTKTSTRVFWEMVAEYNTGVIVMVTNTIEGSRIKCDQYWPDINDTVTFEPEKGYPNRITVEHVDEQDGFTWSERVFSLRINDNEPRRVVQYHFTDWPDYGTPESPHGFVQFVRTAMAMQQRVTQSVKAKDPPLVVHCSAGVGRTGTFIATYAVLASLHYMRRDKKISWNLEDLVRRMRKQRVAMVQSAAQFEFMFKATLIAADQFMRAIDLTPENSGVLLKKQSKAKLIRQPSRKVDPPSPKSSLRGKSSSSMMKVPLRKHSRRARPANRQPTAWDHLVQLLSEPPLAIASILHQCATRKDIEEATVSLFKVFASQGLLLPFMCKLAEWDINMCDGEHLVFRKNSLATKLLTATLKTYGQGFLKRVLQPLVDKMMETPDMSYEINPAMVDKADNLGVNRSNLKRLTESFFNNIMDSINRVPLAVQVLCHGVARATTKKFPEVKCTAVGSCFFLRFVMPAIVSPRAHNIVDGPLPPRVQRGLVLVSKVLQSVANSTRFSGFKEEYMECMNAFVNLASTRGIEFLNKLSAVPPVVDETTLRAFSSFGINLRSAAGEPRDLSTLGRKRDGRVVPGVYEKELKVLLKVLMNHKQHIVESLALSDDKDTADKLSSLLDDLGPWEHPNVPLPELWRPITLHTTPVNDHRFSLMSTPSSYALDGIEAVMQSGEYLDTGIRRAPIHHSSWLEFDKGYRPVHFTANEVASQPEWADPDIEHEYALLSFNNIDEAYGIDRRSYLGLYKIMQGVPRNPLRRTGISGRGVLGRWGPNHFQTTIVTRWRYLSTTGVQQRAFKNNLPVMEVLLKIEHGELHLPTDRRQIALEFPPTLQEYFGFDGEIDVTDDLDPNAICSIPEMVSNAYELYKGVPADDRSTDNAWVELISLWMHCPDECNLPKEVLDGADYVWAPLHCRLDLDDPSLDLLQTVANTCNVYFSDQLPRIVRSIMQEVERRGITTEGLYRVSGSQTKVIATKDKLLEEGFGAVHDAEIPVLTSVLKLLLKEMTPPLLTHALYDDFIACLERTDDTARHQALSAVLQKLPQDNYRLLDSLIRHLKKVAAEEEANRMGIQNLSLVFGPSIMKSPRGVVNDMSDHGQQILVAKALLELPTAIWASNTNIKRRSTKLAKGQRRMANKARKLQTLALQGESTPNQASATTTTTTGTPATTTTTTTTTPGTPATADTSAAPDMSPKKAPTPPPTRPKPKPRPATRPKPIMDDSMGVSVASALPPHLSPSRAGSASGVLGDNTTTSTSSDGNDSGSGNSGFNRSQRPSIKLQSFTGEATDTDSGDVGATAAKRLATILDLQNSTNDDDDDEEDPYASCEDLDDEEDEASGVTGQYNVRARAQDLGNPNADVGVACKHEESSPYPMASASMQHIADAISNAYGDDEDDDEGEEDEYGYDSATTDDDDDDDDEEEEEEEEDVGVSTFSRVKASVRRAKKLKTKIEAPTDQPWFKAAVHRSDLVTLKEDQSSGRFLVYPSKHDIGNYCVSVSTGPGKVWTGVVIHYGPQLQMEDAGVSFQSWQEWIAHYSVHPLACGVTLTGPNTSADDDGLDAGVEADVSSVAAEKNGMSAEKTEQSGRQHVPSVHVNDDVGETNPPSAAAAVDVESKRDSVAISPSNARLRPSVVSASSVGSRRHSTLEFTGAFNEQGGFYQDNFFENLSETYVEQDEPSLEASQAAVEGEEGYVDENGYDEYGGYYDEYGGYYDVEGGYTDAEGNYYEPGSWVPDTITYLEGEVTWVIRGKRSGLRRGKETKTKKWLFLQGEMVFLYELTDMECENPIKTIVVDNTWKATREKMRVILKHRDSTELVIQLEDKDTAKQWVEAFRAAIDGTLEETAVGEEYLQIGDEETQ